MSAGLLCWLLEKLQLNTLSLNEQIEQWQRARLSSFEIQDRPFITLSYAQSLDGSITARRGEAINFSGVDSMALTHQLRSLHDGILVGVGTVLSDDPQLTVRQWSGSNPQPIILDSQLRTPKSARLCNHPTKKCWIMSLQGDGNSFGDNVEILTVGSGQANEAQVPLVAAMSLLRERGIRSLMVEGGGQVITALLRARLADALVLTVAPQLVGGYNAVGDLHAGGTACQVDIQSPHYAQAGNDLIAWGDLHYQG